MISKIICNKFKLNESESLCPWPDFRQIQGYIPVFITISFQDKQRYNGKQWSLIDNNEQYDIMSRIIKQSFQQYINQIDIDKCIYMIYELNKQFNVHAHGIFFIRSNFAWDYNYGILHKLIQRNSKCGSYGIDISTVKDIGNVLKYCNKQPYQIESFVI